MFEPISNTILCVLCGKRHERDEGSYIPALLDTTTRKITRFFFECDDCTFFLNHSAQTHTAHTSHTHAHNTQV